MNQPVIEIRDLSRKFRKTVALDSVSLSVPSGCVFGLVGENGAGKTTLLKHLLGLLRAREGDVKVFGLDPVADPPAVLGRIGYLSEDRDLPDWMRIDELINYTSAFYSNWDPAFAAELKEMFELAGDQRVRSLSRGQRARIGLLLALAHRPDLLLLDEPSSGLDPVVRRDILSAIIRTVADEGRTVVFSSHLLDEVQRVSGHVAMMHQGKLVLSTPLESLLTSHHRLTIRFEQPQDSAPRFQSALSCHGEGREWSVLCNGQREQLEQELRELQAEIVDESSATLDEIFVARVNA